MPTESDHISGNNSKALQLLAAISSAQEMAIEASADPSKIFEAMLQAILEITESSFGFMGEVFFDQEGKPYLKTHALTNISWNAETEALYATHLAQGLEFHNLETLFGATLATSKPVISNTPRQDPRSGGLPEGHPPLTAFLGLPIIKNTEMVGMVGIANRPQGYDEEIITFLAPLLSTCGTLINSFRSEKKRQKTEADLVQALQETRYERARADAVLEAIGDPFAFRTLTSKSSTRTR